MTKHLFLILASSGFLLLPQAWAQTPALSDGQIEKVLLTINEGEIEAGKLAYNKTKNADVRNLAKMMVAQHKDNKKQTKKISDKEHIAADDSDLDTQIASDGKTAKLQLKNAANFDKVYIDQQVSMHQAALEILNKDLLPNVKDLELKSHLEKTRQAVIDHLEMAKTVQTRLE